MRRDDVCGCRGLSDSDSGFVRFMRELHELVSYVNHNIDLHKIV
jgi:hypothetical protein